MVPGAHSTVISAAASISKFWRDRLKESLQLVGREHRRRATAKVNRVYLPLQSGAELPRDCLGAIDVGTHLRNVSIEDGAGKYA